MIEEYILNLVLLRKEESILNFVLFDKEESLFNQNFLFRIEESFHNQIYLFRKEESILNFDWKCFHASDYDRINPKFLRCFDCDIKVI